MSRTIGAKVSVVAALMALLTTSCGVSPSGVESGGEAPTGLAKGTTLYFLDADGRLQGSQREIGRLGTVLGAVQLLLTGIARSEVTDGLHSEIPAGETHPSVIDAGDYVTIHLPFSRDEIGRGGIDQVICTASTVIGRSGRDTGAVRVSIQLTSGETYDRACPVIG